MPIRPVVDSYLHNRSAPGANTNILTSSLTPKSAAGGWLISVVLATSSVLNVTETDGTTAYTHGLNASAALNAGDLYRFYVPHKGRSYTYNFQVETDGVIRSFGVDEVMTGG